MVYVTGDTHGEVSRFDAVVSEYGLKAGDMLLVAGDFGCIFYGDERDETKLDHLAQLPYIILFVDGNHEFSFVCSDLTKKLAVFLQTRNYPCLQNRHLISNVQTSANF